MDYLGLLGLLGLLGFFSGRGLENKINHRINNLPNNESRIAQNEKFIADLKKEVERVQIALQSCLTTKDSDNFSRKVQEELQRLERILQAEENKYATISSLNEIKNKIDNVPQNSDLQNLKATLKEIQREISALENNQPAPPVSVPSDSTEKFEKRIAQLEFQISEQNKLITQYQSYFPQIQAGFNNLNQKLDEQTRINAALEGRIKKLETIKAEPVKPLTPPTPPPPQVSDTPKVSEPPKVPEKPKFLEIKDFQIKANDLTLFSNNPAEAVKSLKIIENVSPLLSFLESSNFEKKENFIRLVKNYQQNIQKFSDKVRRKKFDEDNFSYEVTDAFLGTLEKYFLTKLPVSIYRGNKENFKFYSEFLKKINAYLESCHVYTELIEPKKVMDHNDIEKMNIVKKDTALKSEDKVIDEVERLPYFINYLTEDDELESLWFDGSMVVLKFDGGTK